MHGKQPESISTKTHHKAVVTTRESVYVHIVKGVQYVCKIKNKHEKNNSLVELQ